MSDFLKMLWDAPWPFRAVIAVGIALIMLTLLFTFTDIWPTAHDWLRSTPCPRDQPCPLVDPWFKGVMHR